MDSIAGFVVLILLVIGARMFVGRKSPFVYPYFVHVFDVSSKRNPNVDDLLDAYINDGGFDEIKRHQVEIENWKEACERRIDRSIFKRYRRRQYEDAIDDRKAFEFRMVRAQTRYRQKNYQKIPYKVEVETQAIAYNFEYLKQRYVDLAAIGFECTLREWHSKNQRKLATRELRERIMKRDNYTCQICGKYMPDEVGLQVDHIVPVAKGGKTVPSNLQVLCSKCNGSKSDKT